MSNLEVLMELRSVDYEERRLVGVVAPYDETTYLVPDPAGERILRGAFKRSIDHRGAAIPLYDNHNHTDAMGESIAFAETEEGLVGEFQINPGEPGDSFLAKLRNGYRRGLSAGFQSVGKPRRGEDGVREIVEAKLIEVSAVGMPAYAGAGNFQLRSAEDLADLLAPFKNPPDVNLDPIPRPWQEGKHRG